MKKQKIMIVASAIAIMAAATMTAFGAGVTEKQARDYAEDYVPAGSTYYKTKDENGVFEIKFYNEKKLEKYEVEISKESLKLMAFESEKYDNHGSSKVSLTEKQAKDVVIKEIDDARILSCKLDTDDGYQEYDVYFTTDSYSGKYTIHAESGAILERDIKAGARQSATSKELLSIEKIKRLSDDEVSGGTITDVDLDEKNGSYVYEVETYKDGIEYELVFDAVTGRLLWSESETKDWKEHDWKDDYWYGPDYDDDYDWDDAHEHRYSHDDDHDWDDDDDDDWDDDDDDWDDDEHHYENHHESGHHGYRD